ncbi:MAG: zinc-binding dehydrogenase [Chromatiales bacterium]|nr:zinc-binding dehydrogenase [Chromatiales bacterium]
MLQARRIRIDKPGNYDVLRLEAFAIGAPGPDQVLIEVAAIGVNYADGIIRMGLYESARTLHGYPITPGFEVSGRVLEVGSSVTRFRPGDDVLALTLFDGYSSHLLLDQDRVFPKPESLSFDQAAAIPAVFLTAWFMVHELAHARAGERWLVHSAAGGVGGALAQLGRLAGCEVTGVVGHADKIGAARAAGCTQVIDKLREDLWPRAEAVSPGGFDAIFDANGVSTLGQSYRHLAPTGRLCIFGFASMLPRGGGVPNWPRLAWDWLRTPRFNPLDMTRHNRSVIACNLSFLSAQGPRLTRGMEWLLARFASGGLTPPPISACALDDAARAQAAMESGRTVGKLVLHP